MALLALVALGVLASPAGADPEPRDGANPDFQGHCEPDPGGSGSGSCVLDEPMGANPDVHGTVDYTRTTGASSDVLSFSITLTPPPDQDSTVTGVQLCVTPMAAAATSPYVPTLANTCAGASDDRVFVDEDPPVANPVVFDLTSLPGFTPGDGVWFTLHVNLLDGQTPRTTYVTGSSAAAGQGDPDPDPERSLTVAKTVNSPTRAETFAFTVDCGAFGLSAANTAAPGVVFAGGDASFSLGDGDSVVFTGIQDGTACTVSEVVAAGTWTTLINGTPSATRSSQVTLADDVTLPFVNTSVAGAALTEAPRDGAVQGLQREQVLGAQVTRSAPELPATGLSGDLAGIGTGLVAVGAAMVLATRRRPGGLVAGRGER